jgi:BSD domain
MLFLKALTPPPPPPDCCSPTRVSDRDFWERYFFRVYRLEQEERRRAALVKRLESDDDELVTTNHVADEESKDEVPSTTVENVVAEATPSDSATSTDIPSIEETEGFLANLSVDEEQSGGSSLEPADMSTPVAAVVEAVPVDALPAEEPKQAAPVTADATLDDDWGNWE